MIGQIGPRSTGAEDVQNTVKDVAAWPPWPTPAIFTTLWFGD
jgi:hypothetical protein